MKLKESIYNFIVTKSCYAKIITNTEFIKEIMENNLSLFPVSFYTIFNSKIKKQNSKSYNVLHMASALVLMIIIVVVNENEEYFNNKYGKKHIKDILNQSTICIFEAVSRNMVTVLSTFPEDVALKIQKKITTFLYDKLLILTQQHNKTNCQFKTKKTDIIKYKFNDENIIDDKYKHLNRIEENELISYIDDKYGTIGQCCVLFGWIMGGGELTQKITDNILVIGSRLGFIVKLVQDFTNLENNIKYAADVSWNFIVNCSIHESFRKFDEHKVKFIEGCMTHGFYSGTIKDILENLDNCFDICLQNTNLELKSQYSSFISEKSSEKRKKNKKNLIVKSTIDPPIDTTVKSTIDTTVKSTIDTTINTQ